MQAARGATLNDARVDTRGRRGTVAVLLAVAATVAVLDQLTKVFAVARLSDGRVVDLVDGILRLRLYRNPGAAFSFATGYTVVFSVVAVAVAVAILRLAPRLTSMGWAVGLGGILGGAVGNLVDRLLREPAPLRGHVIDFIQLPHWPVFNLADSAIVGSAVLIVLLTLRGVEYDGARHADPPVHEPAAHEPPAHEPPAQPGATS